MIVGNKKVAMMLILHLDKVPERAEIIAQVKVSGRPYAADNCFHGAKIRNLEIGRLDDWTIGRFVGWTIGRLDDLSVGRFVGWTI
jgi:hypothetical protein